ncbi:MAG: Hpt domain-containing protein [Alphaproteobacteria bacterium]|nr:Hpt domain-containing protein [Alphaproteobacteria bacterium]
MKSTPAGRKAEFYTPPSLAKKVPTKGGPSLEDALRRADKAVAAVVQEFEGILGEELDELDVLLSSFRASQDEETLNKLFRRVHNLRGQGTTLGFPLITRIGTSFCAYLIERNPNRPVNPSVIEQHIQALRIVLKERKAQEGDAISVSVAAALEDVVRRELS